MSPRKCRRKSAFRQESSSGIVSALLHGPIALETVVGHDRHLGLPREVPGQIARCGEVRRIGHGNTVIEAAVVGIGNKALDQAHALALWDAIRVEVLFLDAIGLDDQRVLEAGAKVGRVLCLVDRGEGAAEAFARRGLALEALFNRDDLPV